MYSYGEAVHFPTKKVNLSVVKVNLPEVLFGLYGFDLGSSALTIASSFGVSAFSSSVPLASLICFGF
jgi:hypothetical protein